MANKVPLKKVSNILTSVGTLNEDFERIEEGFDKTLSRDGSGPNQMEALIDMNHYPIINLPKANKPGMPITYDQLDPGTQEVIVVPVDTDDILNGAVTSNKLTTDPDDLYSIASALKFKQDSPVAILQDLLTKIRDISVTPEDFGAVGDGVTDDTQAWLRAIDFVESSGGGEIKAGRGKLYRTTQTLKITSRKTWIDLNGSELQADWEPTTPEWAVEIGDNVSVLDTIGIRNGRVTTSKTSTNLNGVLYSKNVRRRPIYDNLRITSFKGQGLKFGELNWSIQEGFAPLIEDCGTNLVIEDNGNAITIVGIGLDGADGLNAEIRSCVSITFIGGYIQFAKTNGVLVTTSTIGSMQPSGAVNFYSVYFEGNGNRHIIGSGGRGMVINGCWFNCNGMTGPAINLVNWTGANIQGNVPANLGGRLFVELTGTCSLIDIGYQAVTTITDTQVGGNLSGLVRYPYTITSLPTASVLNQGAMLQTVETSGRSSINVSVLTATGTRGFRKLAYQPRKMAAALGSTPITPDLAVLDSFDITVPTTGLTINPPTGPMVDGDKITFIFRQTSAGFGTVTFNAASYKHDLSAPTAANQYASVTFMYSAGRNIWVQVGKMDWIA